MRNLLHGENLVETKRLAEPHGLSASAGTGGPAPLLLPEGLSPVTRHLSPVTCLPPALTDQDGARPAALGPGP